MSHVVGARLWRVALVSLLVLSATALGVRHVAAVVRGPQDPMSLQVNGITYRVLHAEQVSGLSDADLGGMSHGVNSLVTTDRALVRVTLEVAAPDRGGRYDTSLLRAVAGTVPLQPVAGSMAQGTLRRGGHLEGALSYVVPRNGARLRLTAPDQPDVPLLSLDTAGATDGHDHGGPGPTPTTAPSTTGPSATAPPTTAVATPPQSTTRLSTTSSPGTTVTRQVRP